MPSLFEFPFTNQILLEILLVNSLILALAVFGFKNLKKYMADVKIQLKEISDKRKEL
jgi:hypothetical protein